MLCSAFSSPSTKCDGRTLVTGWMVELWLSQLGSHPCSHQMLLQNPILCICWTFVTYRVLDKLQRKLLKPVQIKISGNIFWTLCTCILYNIYMYQYACIPMFINIDVKFQSYLIFLTLTFNQLSITLNIFSLHFFNFTKNINYEVPEWIPVIWRRQQWL